MSMAIVVHGGAGNILPERVAGAQSGCKEAALAGWRMLQGGGSALAAVEAAVRMLEDNPNFNAGTGSCLTAAGRIEMDAGMMEGHTLRVGAVACVEQIKNPIMLAARVLESPHVLLCGRGAQDFAREQGIELCTQEELITERQYTRWLRARATGGVPLAQKHGTVGAVALDHAGHLAAATSTGGIINKHPGRIGDTPLVGCGFYADKCAAVSCTGYGEDFVRLLIARRAAELTAQGLSACDASEACIAYLSAMAEGKGGLIVVDRLGHVGFTWNSEHMAYAYVREGMQEPVAGI